MSKFISKLRNLSSRKDRSTSTPTEAESPRDVKSTQENQISTWRQQFRRSFDQAKRVSRPVVKLFTGSRSQAIRKRSIDQVKRISNSVVKPFTGSHPLHHNRKFWIGLGVGSGAIALGCGWVVLETSLPDSVDEILTYAREGTITIKAADGSVLQEIGPVTHEKLKIWDIPEPVVQAFIASEDRRFREHQGVDSWGILRAAFSNIQAGEVQEGGSTITQQLARIVYLNQELSLWRKFREVRIAQKIENQFEKEQILERYLNLVYLGAGAYGIADAAWVYFSKPVDELTFSEAAMLAGLAPAPSFYSPFENPEAAKERRNLVLQRMEEDGVISAQEAEEAIAAPLNLDPSPTKRLERQAPYFAAYIQKELPKYVSPEVLKAGGLRVETTLNLEWQKAAEETVKNAIERYGSYQNFEQAALVTIDPRNGHIKAMVGGKNFYNVEDNGQYNRATQAQRQPGSTFKTFVYSTAIAAGFSPYQGFLDAPYVVDGYRPENYSERHRGWISMRDALIHSINIVAVRALVDVGWDPIIEVAKKMGIESELKPTYSLALGASEVNLLELTSAYGTLANQGIHHNPQGIRRIFDREGNVIYEADFEPERAIDEESVAIVTWMLRSVVTSGTGQAAQIERPVAGKTGTSDESRDLWFIGYIPQAVTGVWLGNDSNKPTWGASTTAAATWRQFMSEAVEDMPIDEFPDRPDQLEEREGKIKAEPIKPKRSYYEKLPSPERSSNTTSSETTRRSRGSYQRRSSVSNSQPAPRRRSSRQSNNRRSQQPVQNPAPSRQAAPAPAPVRQAPPSQAPAPPPPPAAEKPSQLAAPPPPPAPPASREIPVPPPPPDSPDPPPPPAD